MLLGDRVRLRALEREDIPTFVRWFNDPEVIEDLVAFAPISLVAEAAWFDGLQASESDYVFGVEVQVGGGWRHIGNVGLHGVNWKDRCVTAGIVIGEKVCWGKGYGSEAMLLLLRFAFHELNLHRVELEVFEGNERAQKIYARLGFVAEGLRRQCIYRHGRYIDAAQMSLLRPEFEARYGGES